MYSVYLCAHIGVMTDEFETRRLADVPVPIYVYVADMCSASVAYPDPA